MTDRDDAALAEYDRLAKLLTDAEAAGFKRGLRASTGTLPGLDVEWLHSAMATTEKEVLRTGVILGRDADLSDYADAVAIVYARLAATPSEPGQQTGGGR